MKRPARTQHEPQPRLLREGELSLSDRMTPGCALCGEPHVRIATEASIMLRGQWLPSTEYDTPVFLLDATSELVMLEMPNGQIALVPDQLSGITQHAHMECLEHLVGDSDDDDDDEEEEPEMDLEKFDPLEMYPYEYDPDDPMHYERD